MRTKAYRQDTRTRESAPLPAAGVDGAAVPAAGVEEGVAVAAAPVAGVPAGVDEVLGVVDVEVEVVPPDVVVAVAVAEGAAGVESGSATVCGVRW